MGFAKSSLARLPVSLPRVNLPPDFDPVALATELSSTLLSTPAALGDPSTYVCDATWRDLFALTGTLRTFYGPQGITAAWKAVESDARFGHFVDESWHIIPAAAKVVQMPLGERWVEVVVSFQVELPGQSGLKGACTGMIGVCLDEDSGDARWRVWALRTVLDNVVGWPDVSTCQTAEERQSQSNESTNGVHMESSFTTDVLIVGAGQSGLSVAGRFEALGVKYVIIDSHPNIGDSWGKRYSSAMLHTIREYAYLPFDRTFPREKYNRFLKKDELSRGHATWAHKYGVDKHFQGSTKLTSGKWEDKTQTWNLNLTAQGVKEQVECKCKFLVMSTGAGGQVPWSPTIPGREDFKGIIMHSVNYTEPDLNWKGKKGIVVGTANTAHDVADDMLSASMSKVTMIQRGATYVFPGRFWNDLSSHSYNDNIPTELSDKIGMSGANAVGRLIVKSGMDVQSMRPEEDEYYESLSKSGFKVERTGDLFYHVVERAGGHYFDMGVSSKIARGEINIKSDSAISAYTAQGLAFEDGTELEADIIIMCTGFEIDLREHMRHLFGDEVANRVDKFYGLDDEGEIRGAYKFQHPGLICHGVAQGHARWLSKYVALQIKAALEGKRFAQYTETPVPPKFVDTDWSDMEQGFTGRRS